MKIKTVNYQDPKAASQLADSFETTGFAIIENHPIHFDKVEQSYREWAQFFHDPERFQYLFNTERQEGYVPLSLSENAKGSPDKDLKEFYHLYFPWGRYPHQLSSVTRELFDELLTLGKQLLTWIDQELPDQIRQKLPLPLVETVSLDQTLFRILHYPAQLTTPEKGVRAAAHEDINLITLLPASTEPGLEVKDRQGNWHALEVNPKTIIINAGDMLQEMTDFFYRSTTHRVVNPTGPSANKPRLSMPLFVHPKPEVWISNRYPTAEGYLSERLREIGLKKAENQR